MISNNHSIAVGVILFNPSKDDIDRIVKNYLSFDSVLIYDNSEVTFDYDWHRHSNVHYYQAHSNDGISKAINYMIKFCHMEGIPYLCTMDQDSVFDKENITKLIMTTKMDSGAKVAVYVPRIVYNHNYRQSLTDENSIESVEWAITSGQLLSVELLSEKEFFYDENLFIDRCDKDFCVRIRKAGCEILRNNNSVLYQSLGERARFGEYQHSVIRHYYSFRNRFYFNNKYYSGIMKVVLDVLQTTRELIHIIVYESEVMRKIGQLKPAYSDYKSNRMGRRCID